MEFIIFQIFTFKDHKTYTKINNLQHLLQILKKHLSGSYYWDGESVPISSQLPLQLSGSMEHQKNHNQVMHLATAIRPTHTPYSRKFIPWRQLITFILN